MNWSYTNQARAGDHIWWISDVGRFQSDYPRWRYRYDIEGILSEIVDSQARRFRSIGE
jgi:CDP-paratose 2-epimerase